MNKSEMFLLEVFDKSSLTATHLFKRRISDNIQSIEDWIISNAPKWSTLPVIVKCSNYGNGIIYLECSHKVLYEFKTTNIALI